MCASSVDYDMKVPNHQLCHRHGGLLKTKLFCCTIFAECRVPKILPASIITILSVNQVLCMYK